MAEAGSAKAPSAPRIRAYREFLTPLLHRRFVSAAFLATGVCYLEAFILGSQSSWTWIFFTSILRASLLFVPAIIVFLLRIAQLRFTPRSSASPIQGALTLITELGTYQTITFYFFAAWVFSEVHIHAAPYDADLGWVANGAIYERLKLNEKVIFLRCHAFIVASVQAFIHLKNDYSYIALPVPNVSDDIRLVEGETQSMKEKLQRSFSDLIKRIVNRSIVLTMIGPFIYLFVRPWAWSWSLSFARLVWNIPETSQPSIVPPFHWALLIRTVLQGILLFGLFESCNKLFSLFVAQQPVKRDKPLTADSKDPNGSLINGLQSKKIAVRSYALWELEVIVRKFDERRKSILTEIDRKGDSAWAQVLSVCLELVKGVSARIDGPGSSKALPTGPQDPLITLPKIASPMKPGSVAEPYKPRDNLDRLTHFVDLSARKAGESPPGAQFDLSPTVKKYVGEARDKFLTKEQQQTLSKQHLEASANVFATRVLKFKFPATPFTDEFQPGVIFQQTFVRRIKGTIFGEPLNDKTNIIRAVDILSILLVASVTEDTYGVVSRNVPEVWRAFVKAIDAVEKLAKTASIHWSDVSFNEDKRSDEDIKALLSHLRSGLSKMNEIFSSEASARGLTPADIKDARRLVLLDKSR